MMNTIQSRFIMLVLASVFLSVVAVGVIATSTAVQKTDADAVQIINLTCENEAQFIDSTLYSLEKSVDVGASYALSTLESTDRLFGDADYRDAYTEDVERLFRNIANDTDGAVAFYLRFNADTAGSTDGFLYVRNGVDKPFEDIPPTDIKRYDPDDVEHVGWYYIPRDAGRAIWMEPYQNLNLGIYMISYVVPLYADGMFVGVIGMDINFQVVIDQLDTVRPLNNGYAFLCNKDASVMFNSHLDAGVTPDQAGTVKDGRSFGDVMAADNNGDTLIAYTMNGVEKEMAFQTLRNGMVLATVANTEDIDAGRNQLVQNITIASLIALIIALAVVFVLVRRMARPLNQLADTARQVASGNLDAKIPDTNLAELAALVDAYRVTVDRMKEQMGVIHELAHRDALTTLQNKTAYDERAALLDQAIAEGRAEFAIVMVDVNDLKSMNDELGHNRGDEYLLNAARLLSETFGEQDVYRIGGDEFVVVVEGDALVNVDASLAELDAAVSQARDARADAGRDEPWKAVSLAHGCVRYDAAVHSHVDDVLKQADAVMYANKRAMKADR